jgi:hypothetical protein
MENLVGANPSEVLPHGETKRLVDAYYWHLPTVGIIAGYTPKPRDVHDHFGVFRGVDQVESFGQACVVSCSVFLDAMKMGLAYQDYYKQRNFVFVGVDKVHCHGFIRKGETYICAGIIQHYKFRQMTVSGKIFKLKQLIDLPAYFAQFTEAQLKNYDFDANYFEMVFEIHNIVGQGIKNDKITL